MNDDGNAMSLAGIDSTLAPRASRLAKIVSTGRGVNCYPDISKSSPTDVGELELNRS